MEGDISHRLANTKDISGAPLQISVAQGTQGKSTNLKSRLRGKTYDKSQVVNANGKSRALLPSLDDLILLQRKTGCTISLPSLNILLNPIFLERLRILKTIGTSIHKWLKSSKGPLSSTKRRSSWLDN